MIQLPIRSQDVLEGLSAKRSLELEQLYGNGDLIRALNILGISGPFKVQSPWELEDELGRHLINAGGYAALPFGESHPELITFITTFLAQNQSMSLPQQSVTAWRAALETNLVSLLAQHAPSHNDSQVFFSNSGAEAVEAALKLAKAARPKASIIINFSHAYHGKTLGALSLTPNEEYQDPFRPLLSDIQTLAYGDANAFEQTVKDIGADKIVAVIFEPIQGEAGVIIPPPEFLPAIYQVCQKYGILMIADEIQSGLGRTGHWFASIAMGLEPDIITLAKPLGGGMVATGATIARKWIVKKVLGGIYGKRHSNTFGGNSLTMAVGLKSLELLLDHKLVERSKQLGIQGLGRLKQIQETYPGYIKEVRGAGMLFAIQLRHVIKPALIPGQAELIRQLGTGMALRILHLNGLHVCYTQNSSRTFRLTPALNMPEELFLEMFHRLEQTAKTNSKAWHMLGKTSPIRLLRLAKLAFEA